MIIRRTIFAGLLVALAMPVAAQSVKLLDKEITVLLSGNTAVGTWEGADYRQYFDPDGTTIYAEQGSMPEYGEWRVQDDSYGSIWPDDDDWESWFIMEFAGGFFWVSKTTSPTPFTIVDGDQIVAD
ncbi:MAG: hypothetical protein ACJAXK_000743 [Yoonia sp.]|jgi:hypothetical protein